MSRSQFTTRVLKPIIWLAGLSIPAWLTYGAFTDQLGADPVAKMEHVTGRAALITLFITLAVTPLRRATGFNELIRVRRLTGLFAFFFAVLHFTTYVVFDQSLSLSRILEDTVKHKRIYLGFAALLLLVPLALTSTKGWIRRLGGKRWTSLHRLIYLAAGLGVIHFLLVQKLDIREGLAYGAVFLGLMLTRLWRAQPNRRPGARIPAAKSPAEPPASVREAPASLD